MRIFDQAIETIKRTDAQPGDIIIPFNFKKISDGICPTLTTRPEGLKTMILLVERDTAPINKNGCVDCDECTHRSESCLCDISSNEEDCPLLSEELGE